MSGTAKNLSLYTVDIHIFHTNSIAMRLFQPYIDQVHFRISLACILSTQYFGGSLKQVAYINFQIF